MQVPLYSKRYWPPGPHWPPGPPQSFKLLWAPVRGYDLILTVLGNDLNLTVLVLALSGVHTKQTNGLAL